MFWEKDKFESKSILESYRDRAKKALTESGDDIRKALAEKYRWETDKTIVENIEDMIEKHYTKEKWYTAWGERLSKQDIEYEFQAKENIKLREQITKAQQDNLSLQLDLINRSNELFEAREQLSYNISQKIDNQKIGNQQIDPQQ